MVIPGIGDAATFLLEKGVVMKETLEDEQSVIIKETLEDTQSVPIENEEQEVSNTKYNQLI